MTNEKRLFPYLKQLYDKVENEDFLIDKSGVKVVELIASRIELDPTQPLLDFGVKKTNEEYCKKELEWYLSQDLNIKGWVDDITIWKQVADKNGYINSNYGWCIFSKENGFQYKYCLKALKKHKDTRQALMIYTRPSIYEAWNRNGMCDFICTNYVDCLIRNNKLIYIIHQRSGDAIFGALFNDFYWHCYIYNKLLKDLKYVYSNLEVGNIIFIIDSLHIYSRHFQILENIIKNFK